MIGWLAAVRAFRTAYKVRIGHKPFQLMFGVEARMPPEYELPHLRIVVKYNLNSDDHLPPLAYFWTVFHLVTLPSPSTTPSLSLHVTTNRKTSNKAYPIVCRTPSDAT